MRLPRLTTRRLMAVVVVVAMAMGAGRLVRRSLAFRRIAVRHASEERAIREMAACFDDLEKDNKGSGWMEWAEKLRISADYRSRLKRKYEHAARYPWLSVPPDPPEPK